MNTDGFSEVMPDTGLSHIVITYDRIADLTTVHIGELDEFSAYGILSHASEQFGENLGRVRVMSTATENDPDPDEEDDDE